jgi:1-deoxy-D-xylulose-5-phosphate synthase
MGGYGSIVLECFNERRVATPVVRLAWPDQFIEHASSVDALRQRHGLTAERLQQQVQLAVGLAVEPAAKVAATAE